MKQGLQFGIEGYKDGVRVFRFTQMDVKVEMPPMSALVANGVESMIDTKDAQPGDGEIDIAIPKDQAKKMFPIVGSQIDKVDKVFVFLNLK